MKKNQFIFATILLALTGTRSAQADFILTFSNAGGSVGTTAKVDDLVSIPVFFREQTPESRLSTSGLFGFELLASYDPSKLEYRSFSIGAAFDDSTLTETLGAVQFGGTASSPTTGVGQLQLGTLVFKSIASGSSQILLADPQPADAGADFVLNDGTIENNFDFSVIDADIFSSSYNKTYAFTVTATSVPEPSSCIILSTLLTAIAFHRHRTCGYRLT